MRIAEIYQSVQGEGFLTGADSVFVRTSGCNLRCWFCDTPYTSWNPEGVDLSVCDICEQVLSWETRHVVITGGEPMLFAEMLPLCDSLTQAGRHLTIETAGTLYLPLKCDLMSISPKLANSAPDRERYPKWFPRHEQTRDNPEVIRKLTAEYDYQIKFVVDQPADIDEIRRYLDDYPGIRQDRVQLMPQGTSIEELAAIADWLQPICDSSNWHYCPRRHIEWFGKARCT